MTFLRQSYRFPLLFTLAATLALATGCDNPSEARTVVVPAPVVVRTAAATRAQVGEPLLFAATVQPRTRAVLTFQVDGVLRERPVELGQRVHKGELLARLYNPALAPAHEVARARLQELEARVRQARRELARSERLHQLRTISTQQHEQEVSRLDVLLASLQSARAAVRQSEQVEDEMRLLAPFAGSVEALLVEPGEYVAPGQPVMRLSATSGHEVEVRVPVALLDGLSTGQKIEVRASLQDSVAWGTLLEVGRSVTPGGTLYPLVVGLDSPGMRAGEAVEVALYRRRHPQRLSVPLATVMRSGEGTAVFRVDGERVQRVAVDVLGVQGEEVLLAPGNLKEGQMVVIAGLNHLADNDRVEVLP